MGDVTFHKQKQRVDELLIGPLTFAGMRRQQRFKIADQELFLDQLRNRLAYLDADNLQIVAASVAAAAGGKRKNIWPDLVTITNWARGLQTPPDCNSDLIIRYMRSRAGKYAWDLGPEYALVLRKYLRKYMRPPNDYSWVDMRKSAGEIIGRADLIRERSARGVHDEYDQRWLAALNRAIDDVRRLVFPEPESADNETA
ncbi:MAG: hypothetical protein JKY31_13130 [Rhodobacteraceae bacterium]|nr:hypothetical protein [Paracoccaceae bacterium]